MSFLLEQTMEQLSSSEEHHVPLAACTLQDGSQAMAGIWWRACNMSLELAHSGYIVALHLGRTSYTTGLEESFQTDDRCGRGHDLGL